MQKIVSDYLDDVTAGIKNKSRQKAVRAELASHFAETINVMTQQGFSEQEAAERACEQMGEIQIVKKKLVEANSVSASLKTAALGMFIVLFSLFFSILVANGFRFDLIRAFIDWPSFLAVFGLGVGFALLGGVQGLSKEKLLSRLQVTFWYGGIAGFIIGCIGIMWNLSDLAALGPNLAVCFLSLFYATIFSGIAYGLRTYTKYEKKNGAFPKSNSTADAE